jgi:hypothetical protein
MCDKVAGLHRRLDPRVEELYIDHRMETKFVEIKLRW